MTLEEKKQAVKDYCDLHGDCTLDGELCRLFNEDFGKCPDEWRCDEDVEKAYELIHDDTHDGETVNHPNHYNSGMECIDEMLLIFGKEATEHFCLLNAWKYRYRAIDKNGKEDLEKSHWYINKYKELKEMNNG